METETVFRIILPALIIAFATHRGYYYKKYGVSEKNTLRKRDEKWSERFTTLFSITGFVAMGLYVVNPSWVSWGSFYLYAWLRWLGVGIAMTGFLLLQWAQNTLGKNWSGTPRMIKGQILVTNGPYRIIRHPIYTAFLLIFYSTVLISSNWLIGISWIGMTSIEIASRINFEENLMLEYFGDQYRQYMKTTGRLLPRLIQ